MPCKVYVSQYLKYEVCARDNVDDDIQDTCSRYVQYIFQAEPSQLVGGGGDGVKETLFEYVRCFPRAGRTAEVSIWTIFFKEPPQTNHPFSMFSYFCTAFIFYRIRKIQTPSFLFAGAHLSIVIFIQQKHITMT